LIGLILVILIYYLRKKNPEVPSANVGVSGGGDSDNFGSTGKGDETGYTSTTDTGGSGSGVENDNRKANAGNSMGKEGS
jgi:hypothetical protein